jgi:hypothetical protein
VQARKTTWTDVPYLFFGANALEEPNKSPVVLVGHFQEIVINGFGVRQHCCDEVSDCQLEARLCSPTNNNKSDFPG